MTLRVFRNILGFLIGFGLNCQTVFAFDGTQPIGIGPLNKGTGGAGVARAEDSTWALINPAGLAGMEKRLDISLDSVFRRNTLKPQGPGLPELGGGSLANNSAGTMEDDKPFFNPAIGFALPLKRGTLGVAVSGSGLVNSFPQSRTTLSGFTGENFDRRVEYVVAKVALAYGLQLPRGWAVGLAVSGNYATLRTDSLTLNLGQARGRYEKDEAFGGGFEIGIIKKWDRWSAGVSYISRQYFQEFTLYDDLISGSLDVPEMVQAGIAVDITSKLEFVLDYKSIHWEDIGQYDKGPEQGGVGWENQHIVKYGFTYVVAPKWTLRLGFSHAHASPIADDEAFANGLFSSAAKDHLTAGVSWKFNPQFDVHFTYTHDFLNIITETGTGDSISQVGTGTEISLVSDAFLVGISYKFKTGNK